MRERDLSRWLERLSLTEWQRAPESVQRFLQQLATDLAAVPNFAAIFEAIPLALTLQNSAGEVVYANLAARRWLIRDRRPVSPQQPGTLHPLVGTVTQTPYPEGESPLQRAFSGTPVQADDLAIQHPDRLIPASVWATPSCDPQGQVQYVLALWQEGQISNRAQQRVHQALQKSEALYRQVVQAQTDLILRSEPDTTIVFANAALCYALGLPLAQIIGMKWSDFVPPDDLDALRRKIAALTPAAPTFENTNRDTRADGQLGWTQWINRGIFDETGQLVEIQSVGRDVTILQQQFQRERALNCVLQTIHQSLNLEVVFATATAETTQLLELDCFVVQYFPERGIWQHIAESFAQVQPSTLGLEIRDRGNPFADQLKQLQIVRVASTDCLEDTINQALAAQLPGAWLLVPLAIEGELWGSLALHAVQQPFVWREEQVQLARTIADQLEIAIQQANLYEQAQVELMERRRTEAALRDSETRFRNLAANIPGAIFRYLLRTDGADSVLYMSPGCFKLWELDAASVEQDARPLWNMVHPDDRAAMYASVAESARTLQPWQWTWRIITPSGKLKWLEAAGQPQRLDNGDTLWDSMILDISARKQAELALAESEQRFRTLFESTDKIAVQGYNCQRQVIYWNQASEEFYGYSKDEALGRLLEDLIIPPELRSQVIAGIDAWFNQGIAIPAGELSLCRKDGTRIAVYSSHLMLSNPAGEPEMYCVDIDLSDRKRVEEDLRQALAINQALINAIPDLILRVRRDGTYLDAIATEMVKLVAPPDELIGRKIADILPADLAQQWLEGIERAFQTGKIQFHEYQIYIEGTWYDQEARIVVSDVDEVTILIRNIGDRKQAERALRESEARYRLLAQNTNDLVCLHRADGCYLYASPSCEVLLGYPYQALLGQHPTDFCHPDDRDRLQFALHEAAATAKSTVITYRMRQQSGRYRWLETIIKPISDETGAAIQLQTTSRDVTERVLVQERLQHEATHDLLTGLPNRAAIVERIELALQHIRQRDDYHFAVLFLDLDRFRAINDSLGHLAGDQLLLCIAQTIAGALQGADLAARFGGDEFVILLEELADLQAAARVAERILDALALPLTISGHDVRMTASIGIVWGARHYTQAVELLRDADLAMYRAKRQGRARYAIFNPDMDARALQQLRLENDLRQAIERQEFTIDYQPIANLQTGYLVGFEALIRWQHPTQGRKSPAEFIPLAEEAGLIAALDCWVLETACQQLCLWRHQFLHLDNLGIHVNLSAQDLRDSRLTIAIDRLLVTLPSICHHLTLEITESMLIEDVEATIEWLAQLKRRGLQLSLDDFGTGYSSLSYLHRLPLDTLKVDRSFVQQMQAGARNYRIVETIATLSQQLGLEAIAEGVETRAQLVALQQLGYQFGQGYLISPPLPAAAVPELLAQQPVSLLPA